MKEKTQMTKLPSIALLALIVFAVASICNAEQGWSRKGKGEIFISAQPVSIEDTTGLGITTTFDDTTLYGFGFGGNLDDHFNLNLDWLFNLGSSNATATNGTTTIQGDVQFIAMNLNLDYNILKDRLTPLVTAGAGFMNIHGNWNGSLVSFDETDFAYNLGAGARWDVTDNLAVKAIYRAMWIDLKDTDETTKFDGVSFSLILRF